MVDSPNMPVQITFVIKSCRAMFTFELFWFDMNSFGKIQIQATNNHWLRVHTYCKQGK